MSLANLNKFPPFFVMLSDAIAPRALSPGGAPGRSSLAEERRFRRWWSGGRCVRGQGSWAFRHFRVTFGRQCHGDVLVELIRHVSSAFRR